MKKKLLLATKNPGKILEYRELFPEINWELFTLKDFNVQGEPEEDQPTFEANARKKVAFYTSKVKDIPVLAEDSGLEIDALGGEPGVYSRRWPGYEGSDEELIDMALDKLRGVPQEKRGAKFRVVVALSLPGKETITAEGMLEGRITETIEGDIIPGFPFRSIFFVPELGKVLGALSMEEEAKIAHRKKAITKLLPILEKYYNEK